VRRVAILVGRHGTAEETATDRMKRRIDIPQGRKRFTQRFATVEPVFGNLRHSKGPERSTLRGKSGVDGQWKLYGLVQNIEKLANSGYGG
jgi:hypothetical protein